MNILQERIKQRRKLLNLTLSDLAKKLQVTEATVQRYECGKICNIKHDTIVKIANILECTPQYLMGWSDNVNDISKDNLNTKVTNDENQEMILEFARILDKLSIKDRIKLMNIIYDFEDSHTQV